jgi:hypothetical protein
MLNQSGDNVETELRARVEELEGELAEPRMALGIGVGEWRVYGLIEGNVIYDPEPDYPRGSDPRQVALAALALWRKKVKAASDHPYDYYGIRDPSAIRVCRVQSIPKPDAMKFMLEELLPEATQ